MENEIYDENFEIMTIKTEYGSTDSSPSASKEGEQEKILDYDKLVEEIGEFGLFQKIACVLLWFPAAAGGIHVLMYSFTGLEPGSFRCDVQGCNSTEYDGYIWDDDDKKQSCSYYEATQDSTTGFCQKSSESIIRCTNGPYIFDNFIFDETTVTKFNLLCDNENFIKSVAFTGSVYMFGLMVGSFITGYCSDKFGRRFAILGCILVSSTSSLVGSFMPDFWSYMALRFLTACGGVGLFNEAFTLTVELMGSKEIVSWMPWITYKNFLGNTIQIPYAIGETILGIFAFFIRDYVTLQWVMSALCFVQIPLWFLLPESPRWLISKGKTEEARALMTQAAKRNGKIIDLSKHIIKVDASEELDELGFSDLFKTKDILIITVVMFFCWPIITMGYFGLGLSMTQLGSNIFISFILGALVEV